MSSSTHRDAAAALRSAGVKSLAVLVAIALGILAPLLLASAPASASSTVKAQLSLSGIATQDNPVGGSTVGIHPGDSLTISASTVPTEGLRKLGLSDLLSGVTGLLASYQVEANFSGLPGGAKSTTLKGSAAKTFTFSKVGTYSFTWEAQSVGLLGVAPINLDGNQLKAAGIKLNAQNEYVGKIVVAKNPPKGGISIQLPKTSVQPEVGPVKLPKVTLPGVTTPSISTSVPSLNDGGKDDGKTSTTGSGKTSGTSKSTTSGSLPNVVPIPDMVVPQGSGQVLGSSSGYSFDPTSATQGGSSPFALTASSFGTPAGGSGGTAAGSSSASAGNVAPESSTVDSAASSRPAATSGMPVVLAIIAVIALVLVAGTYARLFLLGGGSASGGSGSGSSGTSKAS